MSELSPEAIALLLDTGSDRGKIRELAGHKPFTLVPEGHTLAAVPEDREKPRRIQQKVSTFTPESFVTYFTDFCNEDSRIFVDLAAPSVTGIIDYHSDKSPEWCEHRVSVEFRYTNEWQAWRGRNQKSSDQESFAQFLEDNLVDIVNP